jgi:hypothetical protein
MSRRLVAAALVAASLAAATPARADDVAEAKARFRRGADLYRQRRWRDAMAEFEAAYRAKPHGVVHFNVAQCRERLEDWPGALRSYHDYLREVPDAADRAAVRASMARLEARLAAAGTQALLVYTDPPGAHVALDGGTRGTTPLHAALAPGPHRLSLALDGYERVDEQVELAAAAARVVEVVLRPAPRPAPAPPDLASRPAELAPAPPAPVPAAPPAPPARARRRLAAWIAAGTAVAAAGAGAWLGWSAQRDERAIDALPAPDRAAASARARDARSKARAANALYAVAGGAAAVGGALLVLEGRF